MSVFPSVPLTADFSTPPAPLLPPWWSRLEILWLLMAPLCATLYALCLALAPNDLWYHVRAGELISRGAIPTQNLMSNGIALTAPYYYQSWLAELGLFWTLKLGGLSGLVILRAACLAGALALVAAATFRTLLRRADAPSRLGAARLTAFGCVIALAMFSNNVDLRPQTFSTLFFGVWVFGALEWRARGANRRAWSAFLIVLTLVWANTHGAFILSILGLGALAMGDFVCERKRLRASLGLALAAALAALLNPHGAGLYLYVADLSRDEISQQWIQEWKSPGFDDARSLLFWGCALLIVGLLFAKTRRNGARGDVGLPLALAVFCVMAARDQRSIIWFALAFVPVFAGLIADFNFKKTASEIAVPRAAQVMNAVLLAFLLGLPLALLPQIKPLWPWPPEFRRRFAATPALFSADPPLLLDRTTPVAAAAWLERHPPRGRLWTDMVCGSYLTYAGRGRIVPLCDPRIELFRAAFWQEYLRLSNGPTDAATSLRIHGFSDALLDRDSMPALVKRLQNDSNWRVVAQNGSTVLFRYFGHETGK